MKLMLYQQNSGAWILCW